MQPNKALLVMDMQASVLATMKDATPLLDKVKAAVAHAKSNNIPVFYIAVGFRNGAPEISTHNKMFGGLKQKVAGINMEAMNQIHPALATTPNDIIVIKRRVSAFTGSDLELLLRAQGINHITLAGFATSGVVLSTLREAADKDYQITVLSDCCEDYDTDVHQMLMTKIFPQQAEVITLNNWIG